MSKRKSKLTPKKMIQIGVILLVFVGCSFFVLNLLNRSNETSEENEPPISNKEKKENKEKQKETEITDKNTEQEEKKEEHRNYEGDNPNDKEELTGNITAARTSGENYIIRVNIDQFITSGTCNLVLEKDGKSYSDQANISSLTSASTCEGFDIPTSELESGEWKLTINLSSEGKTGKIEEGVIVE